MLLLILSRMDKPKVLALTLHCADISHPSKEWALHFKWTTLLIREFFRQVSWRSSEGYDGAGGGQGHSLLMEASGHVTHHTNRTVHTHTGAPTHKSMLNVKQNVTDLYPHEKNPVPSPSPTGKIHIYATGKGHMLNPTPVEPLLWTH